jgi:hypothetical protein
LCLFVYNFLDLYNQEDAMNEFEYNYPKLSGENNLNLFTALSIFATRAPKIINGITEAAKEENLAEIEALAAKLIAYSNQAQLTGFADKAKDLIIAVREHKKSAIDKNADLLKQYFDQMARDINPVATEQKIEFDNSSSSLVS